MAACSSRRRSSPPLIASTQPKVLAGRRLLLTAGPTFEAIDPVRGITNTSSGKMGYAIAQAAAEAGAAVTLVSGPTPLATPMGVARIDVVSAAAMLAAVDANLDGIDAFIAVAAVADYTPVSPATTKMKKSGAPLTITLQPTVDILATVAARPNAPVLRRLRSGDQRHRAQCRRKASPQEGAADGRQSGAGCLWQR